MRIVGVDIGGTYIRAGWIDKEFQLHNFEIRKSAEVFPLQEESLPALGQFLTEYFEKYFQGKLPDAVSLGFPSTINKEKTTVLSAPNLNGFNNTNVVEPLNKRFGIPVFLNKDVNLQLLFDMQEHGLTTEGIVIGCYIGTGLGNAIAIDGALHYGKNGTAGELGHIPFGGEEKPCGCGNRGCAETIASGKHLEELVEQYFEGEDISQIFTTQSGHKVLQNFVSNLAIPIATEINILDPEHIVLGGGVLQMQDFPTQDFLQAIHSYTRKPYPQQNLDILFSSGKQESGVVGAGMYAYSLLSKLSKESTGGIT